MIRCELMILAAGAAASVLCAGAAGQTIVDVGFLPSGLGTTPVAISADGTTVVGSADRNGSPHAFRWTAPGGIVDLGTLPGQLSSAATAVTADGSAIVGHSGFSITKWTTAGIQTLVPWQGGTDPYSFVASGIVGDGSVVTGNMTCAGVGGGDSSCTVYGYAFLADGTTGARTTLVATLPPPFRSPETLRANGVSADGSVVVGWCAAFSNDTDGTRAFRWTPQGGMVNLGIVPGFQPASQSQSHSHAWAVSGDGATVVGDCQGQPTSGNVTKRAFRWTAASGIEDLGVIPGSFTTVTAAAVSRDGTAIVGKIASFDLFNQHALLWRPGSGWVDLNTYLPSVGVDLTGWTLQSAVAISADGRVIAGTGTHGGSGTHGWVVTLPPPACYANCDLSSAAPVLNVADFSCFLQRYAAADAYANCDASTTAPTLNVADFSCFLTKYAAGCP
jgi:probable HAF family extracellular repeat protein